MENASHVGRAAALVFFAGQLMLTACGSDVGEPTGDGAGDDGNGVLDAGDDFEEDDVGRRDVGPSFPDFGDGVADTADGGDGGDGVDGGTSDVGSGDADDVTSRPIAISNLNIEPNPNNRLSRFLTLETSEPAFVSVQAQASDHEFTMTFDRSQNRQHRLLLIGFRADRQYELTIEAFTRDGGRGTEQVSLETASLPEGFPPIEVTVSEPDRMQPGITLFNVYRWQDGIDNRYGYIIGLDEQGEVVWYYDAGHRAAEVELLSNGNLIYSWDFGRIIEIDLAGNVVNEWTTDQLGIDSFHHEISELENGNLVTLSSEIRTIGGYTDSDGDTVDHEVVADVVVEFTRDGRVVQEHSMFDILEVHRWGEGGFDNPFWNDLYSDHAPTKDWTHGNAVIHDPRDDSFIVSLRHQDWLVKIDRQTGALVWRFGAQGDFELTSGIWFYHQHAPMLGPTGNILLFDNGNHRPGFATDELFSRAVEYELDPARGEARQVWEFRDDQPFYSPFLCDADYLLNGNVLITDGGRVEDPARDLAASDNLKFARLVEVTHESDPQKVFEVYLRDPQEQTGYSVYRSDRYDLLSAAEGY